jgi:hypothetical protein
MAYILAVNANIISDTGGTCSPADCTVNPNVPSCVYTDPGYLACLVSRADTQRCCWP